MAWLQDTSGDVKVLLAGSSGVGKSCTLLRLADDIFIESEIALIGVTFKIRHISVGDRIVKVLAEESKAGKPKASGSGHMLEKADAYIIMYDVTNLPSLDKAKQLVAKGEAMYPRDAIVTIAANKMDVNDDLKMVPFSEGQLLASSKGFIAAQISAKHGTGVEKMFKDIVVKVLKKREIHHN